MDAKHRQKSKGHRANMARKRLAPDFLKVQELHRNGGRELKVKKLSERHRHHLIRKSRRGNRKSFSNSIKAERLKSFLQISKERRSKLPKASIDTQTFPKYVSFDAPENFDIYDNYEETLAFLMDVRRNFLKNSSHGRGGIGRSRPYFANFSTIRRLNPASGLLLAAEVDRWSRTAKKKPISVDYLWPRFLRNYFEQAGLFSLLQINPQTAPDENGKSDALQTIAYQSDIYTQGEVADNFRAELEQVVGEAIGPRHDVYVALSEAMANVVGHAYPEDESFWPRDIQRRWWLGGSWASDERIVTVQIYDHGVGIPATLPRSQHWSNMMPILKSLDPERSDAGLIEAAMQYRRTSTKAKGRGKGMYQMAEWIDRTKRGSLRILSGRGSLTYLPHEAPIKRTLPVDFGGTLVEWKVRL